jgi:sec-independent protein translocase protein TatC
VTPFITLSSISFVLGAAFAYYVIFPPAAKYLLGLGSDFRLLLKADDYFDFIIIVMLGMGVVFQMPAITYVLARIGLVTARIMVRMWKTALIVTCRGHPFAYQRYPQHAALRRTDACPLRCFDLYRLDFQ